MDFLLVTFVHGARRRGNGEGNFFKSKFSVFSTNVLFVLKAVENNRQYMLHLRSPGWCLRNGGTELADTRKGLFTR